ncbi:MAG: hypothetical protein E7583_08710 [Ruminococcaceae bacterium]|nr:hypothetical protein [Oscillospiraceae bacterium]
MICRKCRTRNPNNSTHCIRCGAKFGRNSGFNYFIAFIAAASLCVVLAVTLIITILSDSKKTTEISDNTAYYDSLPQQAVASNSQLQNDAVFDDYVAVEYLLKSLGAENISLDDSGEMYVVSFGYLDKEYILKLSPNINQLTYSDNESTYTAYAFDNNTIIKNGVLNVPRAEFILFFNSKIG